MTMSMMKVMILLNNDKLEMFPLLQGNDETKRQIIARYPMLLYLPRKTPLEYENPSARPTLSKFAIGNH